MEPLNEDQKRWAARLVELKCFERQLSYIKRKGYYRELTDDELHDALTDAIVRVARKFDPSLPASVDKALMFQFYQRVRDTCRAAVNRKRPEPQLQWEGDIEDTRSTEEPVDNTEILKKLLEIGRDRLTPAELSAIKYHLGRGPYPRLRGERITGAALTKRLGSAARILKQVADEEGIEWKS